MNKVSSIILLLFLASCTWLDGVYTETFFKVDSSSPEHREEMVCKTCPIRLSFNRALNDSINVHDFTLDGPDGEVLLQYIDVSEKTIRIYPNEELKTGEFELSLSEDIKDVDNNSLNHSFSLPFSTRTYSPFELLSRQPEAFFLGMTNREGPFHFHFNQAISNQNNLEYLISSSPYKALQITISNTALQVTLENPLEAGEEFSLSLSEDLQSISNRKLAQSYTYRYRASHPPEFLSFLGFYTSDRIILPQSERYYSNYSESLRTGKDFFFQFSTNIDISSFEENVSIVPSIAYRPVFLSNGLVQYKLLEVLDYNQRYEIRVAQGLNSKERYPLNEAVQFILYTRNNLDRPVSVDALRNEDSGEQSSSNYFLSYMQEDGLANFRISFDIADGSDLSLDSLYNNVSFSSLYGYELNKVPQISDFQYASINDYLYLTVSNVSVSNAYIIEINGGSSGIISDTLKTMPTDYSSIIRLTN